MKHKNLFVAAGAGFVLILVLLSAIIVQAGSPKTLYLDWRQVVPAGSGDPNMFGEATVDANAGQARLCYTLRVFLYPGTDWPPTGASIHNAPFGSNGPLVVDLQPSFPSERASGCVTINSALAHDIQRNPAQYYLLVTDSSHPEGAARAQLTK
ncbi:MAG TPA: CHRD domain-containing protein [Anaerolineales bacterium]|nr:CHRD domain-containing protein [Anaerolineales bacterium]